MKMKSQYYIMDGLASISHKIEDFLHGNDTLKIIRKDTQLLKIKITYVLQFVTSV